MSNPRRIVKVSAKERTDRLPDVYSEGALVIEHLSYDGDPAIRAAAARAAWARRQAGGDLGVLARLSHDPDVQVRAVASSARSS